MEISCPDCTLIMTPGENIHDDGCPLANEEDRQSERDRQWFRDHPGTGEYFRQPTWMENSIHRLMTDGIPIHRMKVERLSDDSRLRHPYIKNA